MLMRISGVARISPKNWRNSRFIGRSCDRDDSIRNNYDVILSRVTASECDIFL